MPLGVLQVQVVKNVNRNGFYFSVLLLSELYPHAVALCGSNKQTGEHLGKL